jgi:hypothetical protein
LPIGAGIDRDDERTQIIKRGIPIRDCDAAAPYRDLKTVEHFEAPQGGHDRAFLHHPIEDGDARRCFLIFEIPRQRHRAIYD